MRLYQGSRVASGATAVAVHALLVLAVLNAKPIASAITEAAPLTVSILSAPAPAPAPRVPPLQPKLIEPARDTVPLPVITMVPAPDAAGAPTAARTPPPATATPPAPAALPVAAPVFDADYLLNPAPAYPPLSRRLNEEGRVLLRVWVRADGTAERVEIARSSGFDRLDRSALEAVARWRFVPARQGTQAVAASVLVPVAFVLKG